MGDPCIEITCANKVNDFFHIFHVVDDTLRGDIIEANLHLEEAKHARDLIKLEKEDLDNF
jgi:hypothetical protein